MRQITSTIKEGAKAFVKQQYKTMAVLVGLQAQTASDQKAVICWRAAAPVTRGASWLISRPQTTTASTPEA